MNHCIYCSKEINSTRSKQQHELRCKHNPQAIVVKASYGMLGKQGRNQYSKAKDEGRQEPKQTSESRAKGLATKIRNGTLTHTEESKKKLSDSMKRAVLKNPAAYTSSNRGRTKQIIVDGVKLQGQWEVDFYKWATVEGLAPKKVEQGFPYIWNDNEHAYFPDFYIPSLDIYVEVKGYETDRDRAKWLHFPYKLCIIKAKEIKQIRTGSFRGLVA